MANERNDDFDNGVYNSLKVQLHENQRILDEN
jgi:hypothetical protein